MLCGIIILNRNTYALRKVSATLGLPKDVPTIRNQVIYDIAWNTERNIFETINSWLKKIWSKNRLYLSCNLGIRVKSVGNSRICVNSVRNKDRRASLRWSLGRNYLINLNFVSVLKVKCRRIRRRATKVLRIICY